MSEAMERNLENGTPETAEDTVEVKQEQQPSMDDRENAPAEPPKPEGKKGEGKRKKRKKRGVPLAAVAILLVIALVFGAVIGYGYGRVVGSKRLKEAEAQVLALTGALEEAQSIPVYDVFEEMLTEENQSALNDLAGSTVMEDDGVASDLVGEESLTGASNVQTLEEPVIVAEYAGGQIKSDEAAREYSEQMSSLVFAGYNEEEIAETLLDEVLRYMVADRVLEAKAKEMGLYELTEEDRTQIEAEAAQAYSEQLEFYREFVNTDGMTEEEATGAVKSYLQETEGVTLETVKQELESSWWAQKVFDEITKDVSVDEAALQAAYDEKLAAQKASFTEYADDFEFAQMNGDIIVYNLPGYRAVRMLQVGFDNPEAYEAVAVLGEEIGELDPGKDAELIAQYVAEIDGFYAAAEEKALAALNEIQSGADFADVLSRVGEDAGMKDEDLLETGYYVAENSLLWPKEMIAAAMALENPGDVSGIVRTGDGVCILEYVGEVAEGEVALEKVRDALAAEAFESAQYDVYEAQMNQWLEEAKAVYYPERMQ